MPILPGVQNVNTSQRPRVNFQATGDNHCRSGLTAVPRAKTLASEAKMIKADEETLPGSTWAKTSAGEPLFILCARDISAPAVVRMWCQVARLLGVKQRKINEASDLAIKMEIWQQRHGSRTPD